MKISGYSSRSKTPICVVRTAGLHPHIPKKYAAVQTLVLPSSWDIFERELSVPMDIGYGD